jgi:hypothetical protein
MTTNLEHRRGAHPIPRYLVAGDGHRLYASLDYLTGWRGRLERIWMATLSARSQGTAVPEGELRKAFEALEAAVGPIDDALLLCTGAYKSTTLVGPVTTRRHGPLFIKLFENAALAATEQCRAEIAHQVAGGAFRTAPVRMVEDAVVAYELLPRSPRRPSADRALAALVAMATASLARHPARFDAERERAELRELAETYGLELADVCARLPRSTGDAAPAHGDATPWNVFALPDGSLALIDYEEVGLRAPLFDAFHYAVQPPVVAGRPVPAPGVVRRIAVLAGTDERHSARWYVDYLVATLHRDLTRAVVEGRRHRQLAGSISARVHSLRSAASYTASLPVCFEEVA